ncbi:MAG TPA: cytochrome c oxidase assembly protein [Solirubrobacteraceae bacterium]
MSSILHHWSNPAVLVIVVVIALWHEAGLQRLLRRTRRDRVLARRLRSLWFYGGLVALVVALESPIEHWGYSYFYIHMIQHLILLLAAPSLIVAGAPWQPLLIGPPLRLRRPAFKAIVHERWARPLRALGHVLTRPLVAVGAFNVVMVGWQIPGPFNLSETSGTVHSLMNASMLFVGILFWLQIIASPPLRVQMQPAGQAISLVATNFVMFILAMSMTLFTDHSWYSVYDHVRGVGISPFGDQQIGAGLLWVCGDFWAVPAFVLAVRRLIAQEEGVVVAAIERILGGGPARSPGQ